MKRTQSLPRSRATLGLVLGCLLPASCLQVEPREQISAAHAYIQETTGQSEVYDPYAPPLGDDEVQAMLADGLTLAEAQRLALVHGRELQAEFQEIGVAQAAWVQAQLLSNPSVDLLVGFPEGGGRTLFEALLSVELLELWRIPVRSAAAKERLQATVLRIARRSGEVLAEARMAYRSASAELQRLALVQERVELARRSLEAVQAQHKLGAADESMELRAHRALLEAQVQHLEQEVQTAGAIGELAERLSLPQSLRDVPLLDPLPTGLAPTPPSEELVHHALEGRLDLQAFDREIQAMELESKKEGRQAWGDAAGQGYLERPAQEGTDIRGAGLSLTLPLFDQNQAQLARVHFELEQLKHTHASARIQVAQAVRQAATRAHGAAEALRLQRDELLPLSQRNLDLAETRYAGGTMDLEGWLEAQVQFLDARETLIALQLEAALARAALESALGSPLSSSSTE